MNSRQTDGKSFKLQLYIFFPLFMAGLSYGIFFLSTHTFRAFKESCVDGIPIHFKTPLNQRLAGFDNMGANLSHIATSFLLYSAVMTAIAVICRISTKFNKKENGLFATGTLLSTTAVFIIFTALKSTGGSDLQYNCLTIVLICGTIAFLPPSLNRNTSLRSLAFFTLFIVSLLTALRVLFATTPFPNGFVLLTLPLICYYIFFADMVRTVLEQRFKAPNDTFMIAIAVFFVFMIIPFWEAHRNEYAQSNKLAVTTKGNLYYRYDFLDRAFWKTVDYLKKNTSPSETVVVFPEGIGINFFSDRVTPLRYSSFLPFDIIAFDENKILSEIKTATINYIVILSYDSSNFGPKIFGVDYAKKIRQYIDANDIIVKQFGAIPYQSDAPGIIILKKNSHGK